MMSDQISTNTKNNQKVNPQMRNVQEGAITKAVEKQTAKIPSMAFLIMAGGAVALSLGLAATNKNKGMANFVGLWVPSLLLIGVYNKLVKLQGSDHKEVAKTLH